MKIDYTYRVWTYTNSAPSIEQLQVVKRTAKQVVFKKSDYGAEYRELIYSDTVSHFKTEKEANAYMLQYCDRVIERCQKLLNDVSAVKQTLSK